MILSDEDTRAEFARMREAALREVLPPGAEAAHRTVRRRRRRVAVASSGLAVLAVAGGIALAQPRPQPQVRPDLAAPATEMVTLAEVTPGPLASLGPVGEGTPPPPDRVKMMLKDGIEGKVQITIVCSGTATGTATLATEKNRATAKITCGTPPISTPLELDPGPGLQWVDLSIDWDPGAKFTEMPDGWTVRVLGAERN